MVPLSDFHSAGELEGNTVSTSPALLAKVKRLVALVAARTDELDQIGHKCRHAMANDLDRPGIDQFPGALEPQAVAVRAEIRIRIFALTQLTPDARKGVLDIGFVARCVFERRIENRFHGEVPMCVAASIIVDRFTSASECHDYSMDVRRYVSISLHVRKISSATEPRRRRPCARGIIHSLEPYARRR